MDPENFGKIIHLSTPYDQKTHGVKNYFFLTFAYPVLNLLAFGLASYAFI